MANGEKEGVGWGRRLVFLEPLLNQLCKDSQKLQASWVPSGQGRLQRLQTAKMVLSQGGAAILSPSPKAFPELKVQAKSGMVCFKLLDQSLSQSTIVFFFFFKDNSSIT